MNDVSASVALCVDCDGTLIRTDLLHEAVFLLLKKSPLSIFLLPIWLLRGKAYLKQRVAEQVEFNWASLPYCQNVLGLIQAAKAEKREIVLATASPLLWAQGIAGHLGVFDRVVATEGDLNLSGVRKAQLLSNLFGEKKFDYAGNGWTDLHVWKLARKGVVVTAEKKLLDEARNVTEVVQVISVNKAGLKGYLKALRVHQWLKNMLVFVPLFAAHQFSSELGLLNAIVAFLAFSLCASSVYVLNDLLDLEADREHVRKRNRPFAAAVIPVWVGLAMVPVLLGLSALLCAMLPPAFFVVLVVYFLMTLAYSLRLKKQVIVDVMLLAALYTMRIIAGASATSISPSFWLLAFSMFIFLSLAVVKRYSEMSITLAQNKTAAAGRGYLVGDLPVLASIGASAGIAAVLVLALYINDPETARLYPSRMWLWLIPPMMLYWVSRVWMKTCRGEIDDDPVVFAIKDWQSLLVGGLLVLCFMLATLRF